MEKALFQLKFTAKTLQRQSKKATKDEAAEKTKVKKAIQQGNLEGARIYAANAIRKKNESLNFLRLASRIDSVASRVQTAVTMRRVTNGMVGVVKGMDRAMDSMNLEKISMVMDKFETQFEDMDVQADYMESAMNGANAMSTPQADVDDLLQQVAEEAGLELKHELGGAAIPAEALPIPSPAVREPDQLMERLAKLRNS